jgi:uncharacterized protein
MAILDAGKHMRGDDRGIGSLLVHHSTSQVIKMKIWLDTSPDTLYQQNDCINPSAWLDDITWPLTDDEVALIRLLTLKHAAPLYIEQCGEERWMVCNPTGSGHIAVLDAQALSLFSLFEAPMNISQAIQKVTNEAGEGVENIVALLYRLGFLCGVKEYALLDTKETSHTLTAWIHVTNNCNLRCHYCYVAKSKEDMSADTGYQAVDAIFRSAAKNDFKDVRLKYAGGEASLHMPNVMALHDYAVQRSQEYDIPLEAYIISNGVVLSQTAINQLKTRHISVTISLDGLGEAHDSQRPLLGGQGSSRYVLRTIDRLLANEVVPFISITVSRRNLEGLPDLMRYILERDLPFSLNYYRDNDFSARFADLRFLDEQLIAAMRSVFAVIEELLPARSLLGSLLDRANIKAPHHHTCGVGQNYLVIDQHGGIAKCQMEMKRTITTIKADDPLQIIRADRRGVQGLAVEEKEGCRTCDWRYWCTGGCPLVTYRATGRYDVKSPNCTIYKTLFPEVLRLEALRLLRYSKPVALNSAGT